MSKTVTDIAGSLACQLNQIICPKITFQEKVRYMRSDPMLWNEFLQELNDSKIVTNFGVKEILARFIAERDDKIVDAYKCSLKAAAQKPVTTKEDKTPKVAIGSVIHKAVCSSSALSGMAAAASSVKRSIQRRTSTSFELQRPSADQKKNASDSFRRHSDVPRKVAFDLSDSHSTQPVSKITRKVTFDLSESSSKTTKKTSREQSKISVDNFRRNASISKKRSSLSAAPRFSENWPRTVVGNSSSPRNAESSFNGEPSPDKYNVNVAKMDLILKRMATSTSPSTGMRRNAEKECPNQRSELGTWRSKCVVKTGEEKDVQVGYSCSTETSFPEKLTKMDMSLSKKLNEKASISFQNKYHRKYFDTQFHIEQDANRSKRIAHSTPCMWKATDAAGFVKKGKNQSSYEACFELSRPQTPVELLTMYLD